MECGNARLCFCPGTNWNRLPVAGQEGAHLCKIPQLTDYTMGRVLHPKEKKREARADAHPQDPIGRAPSKALSGSSTLNVF